MKNYSMFPNSLLFATNNSNNNTNSHNDSSSNSNNTSSNINNSNSHNSNNTNSFMQAQSSVIDKLFKTDEEDAKDNNNGNAMITFNLNKPYYQNSSLFIKSEIPKELKVIGFQTPPNERFFIRSGYASYTLINKNNTNNNNNNNNTQLSKYDEIDGKLRDFLNNKLSYYDNDGWILGGIFDESNTPHEIKFYDASQTILFKLCRICGRTYYPFRNAFSRYGNCYCQETRWDIVRCKVNSYCVSKAIKKMEDNNEFDCIIWTGTQTQTQTQRQVESKTNEDNKEYTISSTLGSIEKSMVNDLDTATNMNYNDIPLFINFNNVICIFKNLNTYSTKIEKNGNGKFTIASHIYYSKLKEFVCNVLEEYKNLPYEHSDTLFLINNSNNNLNNNNNSNNNNNNNNSNKSISWKHLVYYNSSVLSAIDSDSGDKRVRVCALHHNLNNYQYDNNCVNGLCYTNELCSSKFYKSYINSQLFDNKRCTVLSIMGKGEFDQIWNDKIVLKFPSLVTDAGKLGLNQNDITEIGCVNCIFANGRCGCNRTLELKTFAFIGHYSQYTQFAKRIGDNRYIMGVNNYSIWNNYGIYNSKNDTKLQLNNNFTKTNKLYNNNNYKLSSKDLDNDTLLAVLGPTIDGHLSLFYACENAQDKYKRELKIQLVFCRICGTLECKRNCINKETKNPLHWSCRSDIISKYSNIDKHISFNKFSQFFLKNKNDKNLLLQQPEGQVQTQSQFDQNSEEAKSRLDIEMT